MKSDMALDKIEYGRRMPLLSLESVRKLLAFQIEGSPENLSRAQVLYEQAWLSFCVKKDNPS